MPNPFQPLYDEQNRGMSVGKYARLPDFPRIIDIEATSACNFGCLMCPTGNLSLKRRADFLHPNLFSTIVDQCAPHKTGLRFIGWGEPLLHGQLENFIEKASGKGLMTHVNTNGSLMGEETARALMAAGLSSLKFSFQGVDAKSYREMRRAEFDDLIETMRMVKTARGRRKLPWLQVSTSTTYETAEQIEEFVDLVTPFVDQVNVGHTTFDFMDMDAVRLKPDEKDMLERLAGLQSGKKEHPKPCPEVYDKLSVHADGSVRVCCNDFNGVTDLGNVRDTPIKEMWRHKTIEEYRKRLANHEYTGPLCSVCYDYQALTDGVEA